MSEFSVAWGKGGEGGQGREGVQLPDSLMHEAVLQSAGPRLETEEAVCLCDRYIINALGDVGSDSLSVFLEVCSIVVCGSLLEHIPVSGVETVLKCL